MSFTIGKKFRFAAAHQLYGMPEGHKCSRLHGHSYEVEVVLASNHLDEGLVLDYADLTVLVMPLIAKLDHRYINDVLPEIQPSAERIAQWFYNEVDKRIIDRRVIVDRVRVCESPDTWAEYDR